MITIKLKGFDKTIKDVQKLATDANKNAKIALVNFGKSVETDAKRNAPKDEGKLSSSINSVFDNKTNTVKITVASDYAAYQEFGTRKFAAAYVSTLPKEWRTYAATFKGKAGGGDYFDFLNAILDWVQRKGLANRYSVKTQKAIPIKIGGKGRKSQSDQDRLEQIAYIIALKIITEGIKPKKFLYEATKKNTPILGRKLAKIFS
jgi:HK97 gp10 family phage protein